MRRLTHISLYGIVLLKKDSVVLLEQIRTIDRERLRGYIRRFTPLIVAKINSVLAINIVIEKGCMYE